jgi:hypothetical protein
VEAVVDGEAILLSPVDGRCHSLNGTAGRVWSLLESPRGTDDVVSVLLGEFDVTPEQCAREVDDLLDGMLQAGVVVRQ